MIPDLTFQGLLPPGRHPTTLAEIESVFVKRAPHPEHRALIFRTLELYLDMAAAVLPGGSAWIDGGFCTFKADAPHDVDVTLVVPRQLINDESVFERLVPLLTLQNVSVEVPYLSTPRVQPMGGLVDGFMFIQGDAKGEQAWDEIWSSVKGPDGEIVVGATKGYLEVTW